MYDLDAIEAINVDQIVTATDRLLFGNVRKRAPTARPRTHTDDERTVHVRRARSYTKLVGVAAIASLAVAVVCLLV